MPAFDYTDPEGNTGSFYLSDAQLRTITGDKSIKTRSAPPRGVVQGSGYEGSVDIGGRLDPYQAEADKRRGPGNYIRCVIRALAHNDRDAHETLVRPWDSEGGGYNCWRSLGDERYQRTMVEGIGGAGGYTVPVLYEQQVFAVASEQSVLISRAEQKPLANRQVNWPALNQYVPPTSGQAAWYGGMQVFRQGETDTRTAKDLQFRQITMTAMDLTAYTELSRDLVADSTANIDRYVVEMMGKAIGWREDWEAFNGNGNNQFEGVLNSGALLSVGRHTDAEQVAIKTGYFWPYTFHDVIRMKRSMLVNPRDPVWFIHPYNLANLMMIIDPSLRLMFIPNTTERTAAPAPSRGGDDYAGGPSGVVGGGITQRPSGFILGDPVFLSEKVPPPSTTTQAAGHTYANANDLLYVDCGSYWVGRRSGLEVGLSEHFKFQNDLLAIRAKTRNDGKPAQLEPIPLADGLTGANINYVSGFVGLGAGS
jgi:HK97 family phage major capsid protein